MYYIRCAYFENFSGNSDKGGLMTSPFLGVQEATWAIRAPTGLYGKCVYTRHLNEKKMLFLADTSSVQCSPIFRNRTQHSPPLDERPWCSSWRRSRRRRGAGGAPEGAGGWRPGASWPTPGGGPGATTRRRRPGRRGRRSGRPRSRTTTIHAS